MSIDIRDLLSHEDESVRRDAVAALAKSAIDRHETVAMLVEALKDASWRVRKAGVDTLLEAYEPPEFLFALERLLYEDNNAGARNSALEAFVRLGPVSTPTLVAAFGTDNADVRKFIVDIVGEIGDDAAVPMLIGALKDEDENVKASAVEHLGTMREPSVKAALVEIIESGDLWTSYPAVEALGNIGDKESMPLFLSLLEKKMLREPALRALGKLGGESEALAIVPYIGDRSRAVQHEALDSLRLIYRRGASGTSIAKALTSSFGDGVAGMMLEYAASSRENVRDSAILLLGLLRDEQTLVPLIKMTGDSDLSENVREAFISIGRKSPEALRKLVHNRSAIETRFICDVMAEVASPEHFDDFITLLNHDDGHVRSYAVRGLANIGDERAVGYLLDSLADQYADVQEAVVQALVSLRSGLDLDSIVALLKNENPQLRRNAIMVLGQVGTTHTISTISFSLKDDDSQVRKAAVHALSIIKTDSAYESLLVALTDEDPSIRAMAVGTFGSPASERHLKPVLQLLSDSDEMVRAAACKAVGRMGGQGHVQELSELLDDASGYVAISAIEAMASLGGDEAQSIFFGLLSTKDPEKKRTVIMALGGFPGAKEKLLGFLQDPDWATRVAAVEALGMHREDSVTKLMEEALGEEDDSVVIKAFREYLDA